MNISSKIVIIMLGVILTAIIVIFPIVFLGAIKSTPDIQNDNLSSGTKQASENKDKINEPAQGVATIYKTVKDPPNAPWQRYGVVLDLGKPGDYDSKGIESPLIIKSNDGTYVIFYRGQTYQDKIGRVMRATSIDGKNWNKTGVVMEPRYFYEGDKIDPMAVIYEDGIYKMWYGGTEYGGCACYATSPDGIQWTRYAGNPVLRKTSGNWDNEGAGGQLTVVKIANTYVMYYKGFGNDKSGWTFYGLAESSDGITWIKRGKSISPQPEFEETTTFRNLFAFRAGDSYYLMHTMVDYLDLFLLQSNDGKTLWTKKGVIFRHGLTTGGWDIKWSTSPCVIIDGNTLKMWYEGGDSNGRVRTLYAEINKDIFFEIARNTIIGIDVQK